MPTHLRVAWLEEAHSQLSYYDAVRPELSLRGHSVSEVRRPPTRSNRTLADALSAGHDVVLVAFGFFTVERGPLPRLPEFERAACGAEASSLPSPPRASPPFAGRLLAAHATHAAHAAHAAHAIRRNRTRSEHCLCGRVPLVVMVNKEYALLREKLAWLRAHCVDAALSVHHDAPRFEAETGVPFWRIWFGVDALAFANGGPLPPSDGDGAGARASSGSATPASDAARHEASHTYSYDLGFTGVVRTDQTANWRYRIWRHAWPALAKRGLRLFSGPPKGVHLGVTHMELNASEYVRAMRGSKAWLSTSGPADLIGTRYFEVMATGTTLCVCNRMPADKQHVYESLGIRDGRHVLMFDSLEEFAQIVVNYTTLAEYEPRRLAIVRRAQALAFKKFTWAHVAGGVEEALLYATGHGAPLVRTPATAHRASAHASAHAASATASARIVPANKLAGEAPQAQLTLASLYSELVALRERTAWLEQRQRNRSHVY